MKGKLEFNLPEEDTEFLTTYNGIAYRAVLLRVDEWARRTLKDGHKYKTADAAIEAVRDKLREELDGLPL
ncbi:MAG: hypothetical protein ACYSR9_08560 [Planctomycetota bacterium]|jgi:hypothetical protein